MTQYCDSGKFEGGIIEPLALNGLDSLFCKNYPTSDYLFKRLVNNCDASIQDFEFLLKYVLDTSNIFECKTN